MYNVTLFLVCFISARIVVRNTYVKILIYLDQRSYEIPKFSKIKVRFEISTFEIGYMQNLVKIKKLIPFVPKIPKFGHFWLEIWKRNASRKFQISLVLKFWVFSGRFVIFWGCFGWFQLVSVVFGSFWLVSTYFGWFRLVLARSGF